jgi:hypothetical protein
VGFEPGSTYASSVRAETNKAKVLELLKAIGLAARGGGTLYLTGGATAVLEGWRNSTVDVDLKLDPEPPGVFEGLATLKDSLDMNVELASPDQFVPALPGWKERSRFIGNFGAVSCYHFDPYTQALSKLEREHERDLLDVRAMVERGWVELKVLLDLVDRAEGDFLRFPGLDFAVVREKVARFVEPA